MARLWNVIEIGATLPISVASEQLRGISGALETRLPTDEEEIEVWGVVEALESLFTAIRAALEPDEPDLLPHTMYAAFWARARPYAAEQLKSEPRLRRVVTGEAYRQAVSSSPKAVRELELQSRLVRILRREHRAIRLPDLSRALSEVGLEEDTQFS